MVWTGRPTSKLRLILSEKEWGKKGLVKFFKSENELKSTIIADLRLKVVKFEVVEFESGEIYSGRN